MATYAEKLKTAVVAEEAARATLVAAAVRVAACETLGIRVAAHLDDDLETAAAAYLAAVRAEPYGGRPSECEYHDARRRGDDYA